jgi:hypothetical protein
VVGGSVACVEEEEEEEEEDTAAAGMDAWNGVGEKEGGVLVDALVDESRTELLAYVA